MPRLPFISLDGLDGTGKSTQCRLLADWLRTSGHAVTTCIDPGGTPLGGQLRSLVLHYRPDIERMCEALLFMASRAQLVGEIIRPALESGQIVISDRFLLANVVYQGHAGGLDVERLWEVGRFATGGLEPDLTLVLDLPLELAASRRGHPADRIESRDADYHARLRRGFLTEARRCPERIRIVDAAPPLGAVQEAIRREVASVLRQNPASPQRQQG
ncbi:MAG TPA: dTMP kinase [Gemmataceae bacterium]|nr:dTMP kinase [Gemmataceae bacterium]